VEKEEEPGMENPTWKNRNDGGGGGASNEIGPAACLLWSGRSGLALLSGLMVLSNYPER